MQRRHLLFATIGLAGAAGAWAMNEPRLVWRERALLGLGTSLSLRAAHVDAGQAERALDAAAAAIRRVESAMSLYRADAELVRLNREGFLDHPSAELLEVLETARGVSRRSRGRFDVTVQPLWALYDAARREDRLPTPGEIQAARARVGWRHLKVSGSRIALTRPGMAITCNGIAQGYAADLARGALRSHGVEHALINAGEFSSLGSNPQGRDWTLGVEDPRDEHRLVAALRGDGRAVATSADRRSAFTPDLRHHHIFDPASGDSPPALSSVTVLAPSAMLADALTKVMFVAGPQEIPALAKAWQVGVLWVDKAGRWQATPDVPVV
ncbi:MAG: FAD:protein FMN transferase [Hydrogenophaga sp.]|nr:FAD:protein FMN transferase [Hydrogenophaga sp.]